MLQITYKQYLQDTTFWDNLCDQHKLALHLTQEVGS